MKACERNIKPAVVIPVYTLELSTFELISFKRTLSTLEAHPIFLLVPRSRACLVEHFLCNILNGRDANVRFHLVCDRWLDSISSYNHLMLTPEFYEFYKDFSHLLIVQLDAYVFRDELTYWCRKPWSYIGAPIYPEGSRYGPLNCQCIGVGGFSLRNVRDFRLAFSINPSILSFSDCCDFAKSFNWRGRLGLLQRFASCLLSRDVRLRQAKNSMHNLLGVNEDVVFGKYLPRSLPWFLAPDYSEACRFSLDRFINEDLELLGRPPFGAHAWFKTDASLAAWKPFIEELV